MLANTKVPNIVAQQLQNHPNDALNLLNTIFQNLLSGKDVKKSLVIGIFSFFPNHDISQQSDAHEFLLYLLSLLGLNNSSMFSFSLRNCFLCSCCSLMFQTFENMNHIQVNIDTKCVKISDILLNYFNREYLVDFQCSNCSIKNFHRKKEIPISLPQYLIVKLVYDSIEKMQTSNVSVQNEIKIIYPNGLTQNYKLSSLLYYAGNGLEGHYWSVTYKEGQLRIHNDARSGYLKRTSPREYGIDTIIFEKCFPTF